MQFFGGARKAQMSSHAFENLQLAQRRVFHLTGKNITLVGGNGDGQTCKGRLRDIAAVLALISGAWALAQFDLNTTRITFLSYSASVCLVISTPLAA